MEIEGFETDEFTAMMQRAIAAAREETLKAGVPLFYFDEKERVQVMERPDGRKFEIRYRPGFPADQNFEVVREIAKSAA